MDKIKSDIMKVERKTDELINQCRNQLLQKKQLIINDLNLTKRSLLQKVNINPKCWNIDSLEVSLDASNPSGIASFLEMNIAVVNRLDTQQQVESDRKFAENLTNADMIHVTRKSQENKNRKRIGRRKWRELKLLSTLDSTDSDWI